MSSVLILTGKDGGQTDDFSGKLSAGFNHKVVSASWKFLAYARN